MKNKNTSYIGLGLCLGVALGLVFNNIAIGVGLYTGKNKNK